jgi:hypothetical protein
VNAEQLSAPRVSAQGEGAFCGGALDKRDRVPRAAATYVLMRSSYAH